GIAGGGVRRRRSPHGAGVRVLPRGAYRAILSRVGAEEVGDDLLVALVEQRGLRREKCKPEARETKWGQVWNVEILQFRAVSTSQTWPHSCSGVENLGLTYIRRELMISARRLPG